jgi:hypothetical protein
VNVPGLAFLALLVPVAQPSPSPRPITDSVEKVVERLERERQEPCLKAARLNVPCFPVKAEKKAFDASVRESLGIPLPAGQQSPDRPPTREEMADHRPTPTKPLASVTIDPVCAAKAALKRLRGRNDVYYLYRVRDVHGERVVLYDHRLDASRFQGDIAFLGKFDGECEAQAAYRREQRRGTPSPSPPPP